MFEFNSVPFGSGSVRVHNSNTCKIHGIWVRNGSGSVRVFRTKNTQTTPKPEKPKQKISKNIKIPKETKISSKILSDEQKYPKFYPNTQNIFLNFETLHKPETITGNANPNFV